MKHYAAAIAGALLCISAHAQTTIATPPTASNAAVEVFFSPGSNVDQALAAAILSAGCEEACMARRLCLHVRADREALHEASERKIDVRVVLDQSQATAKYSSATYFHNQGVPLRINARYPIMHHKFLVIDDDMVGFG